MEILYGTYNETKVKSMKELFENTLNLELIRISDLERPIQEIIESETNPSKNVNI